MWIFVHTCPIITEISGKTKRRLFEGYIVKPLKNEEYSGFMTTGALGHTNVRLHLADIQENKECRSYQ